MIKLIIPIFLILVFTSMSTSSIGVDPEICHIQNTAFQSGEKLVYKTYYNLKFIWIPAGEVTFYVSEDEENYEISVDGRSYPSYDSFFKVRDYYYSRVDKETMYPRNFVRKVEEGDYRKFDSIAFDQKNRTAISFNGKTKESAKMNAHALGECMQDLVSILYFLRNTDVDQYKVGDYIPTKVFFDKETFPINVTYDGIENGKKIKDLGKFNTLRVIPDLVAGEVFKKGDKMKIWVSNDENKLPLLIESPVSVGSIKAVLKSYEGLRYPLTAKLK
ncbi:MAG TPA: DUF3108 domain-containing protein [Saprospiraceae bacterium]|nr:DUF3108 domain-containing protein [Lewinellaceae bacterium]HPK10263.1 DUF3108 domain-containing protein [Saprospiraceae bacterium]HPQ22068.1 DUF3108 domain-containing protein [Saprospiraceae bacterium]